MSAVFNILVPEVSEKIRLDIFIFNFLQNEQANRFSRSEIKNAISSGDCRVNGHVQTKSGFTLKGAEKIQITITPSISEVEPDSSVKFEIIYQDESLIVINKPAGLIVHPAPGVKESTLVHGILSHLVRDEIEDAPLRPGIVHRLDKDTSGLMVVAKTSQAKRHLQAQLKEPRTMKRVYHAVCLGVPKKNNYISTKLNEEGLMIGTISAPIIRSTTNRVKFTVSNSSSSSANNSLTARNAVSHFRVLKEKEDLSFIEFTLETGRTHQIRVHAEYANCPILGDKVYGFKNVKQHNLKNFNNPNRQMLHARKLSFLHPETEKLIEFEGQYPEDFVSILEFLD